MDCGRFAGCGSAGEFIHATGIFVSYGVGYGRTSGALAGVCAGAGEEPGGGGYSLFSAGEAWAGAGVGECGFAGLAGFAGEVVEGDGVLRNFRFAIFDLRLPRLA